MALQTRNVFIDTQAFVKAGLDFQSRTIKAFAEAAHTGNLNHIMTTVTVREIKDKIRDSIKEGLNRVLDFRRKAKLLEGSSDPVISGLFTQYDPEHVHAQAQEVFQSFMTESKTVVADLKKVDAEEIFRRYFEQEPPFQDGKKKDEFPDAFSLAAVESVLNLGEECYVVSEDGDLRAFCNSNKRFILVEDIGKLLDIYNSHDVERSSFIKSYVASHTDAIKKAVEDQINDAELYNNSTWEDSEVTSHNVIEVGDFDPEIIHIDDESCLVSSDVKVRCLVEVEGPDFVNGVYDREHGGMFALDNTLREEEQEFEVKVEIEIYFEVKNGKFEISDMITYVPGLSSGIEVAVEEQEYFDPRG